MRTADLAPERLETFLRRFPACRVAVVGDFFLDKYLDVDPALEESSLETGRPAHQVVEVRSFPGAAGTIVSNLAALGAGRIHAIGFTGRDGEGWELRRGLQRLGCDIEALQEAPDRFTPAYLKPRNRDDPTLAGEHSRYDIVNRVPLPEAVEHRIVDAIDGLLPEVDAVIVMDQIEAEDCGAVTSRIRTALSERARTHPDVVFWADSRRRIRSFQGLIAKANQFEAMGMVSRSPRGEVPLAEVRAAAERLRLRNGAPVVVTRGIRGMIVSDPRWTEIPALKVEGPVDPTGAGDSVTAAAVLSLCAGADPAEAAVVGTLAASITIEQLGVTGTASPEEIRGRLRRWRAQRGESDERSS